MRPYALALLLLTSACGSIGPKTVSRDRFDYAAAVGDSWKVQMLLNIVKLRYLDTPTFLDVQQIVAGYTLEGSAAAGWSQDGSIAQGWTFGANGKFTDRPTLTYRPLDGAEFNKELMTPIPPFAVFFMVQMGWPVDLILRMCVQSFNGIENRSGLGFRARTADPKFDELVALMEKLQMRGRIGMRLKRAEGMGKDDTVIVFRAPAEEDDEPVDAGSVAELIGTDPTLTEYRIFYGTGNPGPGSIAIQSRSILHILIELASYVSVPPEHEADGRVVPVIQHDDETDAKPLLDIRTSSSSPSDTYVSVKYRGNWFYIDDRDSRSKRTFTFLSLLASLAETGTDQQAPMLTIPTG